MSSTNNLTTFVNGMKRAKQIIDGAFDKKFEELSKKLFKDLCDSKFFSGFTGNTQRSYTVAYFLDGQLRYFIQGKSVWEAQEVRLKVKKGEKTYLAEPYEGKARRVMGTADVDDYYGWRTAYDLVMNNGGDKGFQIVCAVGTEYYFMLNKNPYNDMGEQINYYLQQDRLLENMFKQVNGLVQLQLAK